MNEVIIEEGIMHSVPEDMKVVLLADTELLARWNKLTPVMRNEWICWTTIVKLEETRKDHIRRLQEDILNGKKRPCCWQGCPHRNENARKYFKNLEL
ncbi:MAG: YdeI/OmpD-associated family protein [Saprospiraceae bacterium]|nr:YdeI/OmpD-associated family protein [Saprospiraceae bacterium]